MKESDVLNVMREALYEFPVLEVNVNLPSWVMVLNENHWLSESYQEAVKETVKDIKRLRDVDRVVHQFSEILNLSTERVLLELRWGKGWLK